MFFLWFYKVNHVCNRCIFKDLCTGDDVLFTDEGKSYLNCADQVISGIYLYYR